MVLILNIVAYSAGWVSRIVFVAAIPALLSRTVGFPTVSRIAAQTFVISSCFERSHWKNRAVSAK